MARIVSTIDQMQRTRVKIADHKGTRNALASARCTQREKKKKKNATPKKKKKPRQQTNKRNHETTKTYQQKQEKIK
jgi:hypothetical protein